MRTDINDLARFYREPKKRPNVYFILANISALSTSTRALVEWKDGITKFGGQDILLFLKVEISQQLSLSPLILILFLFFSLAYTLCVQGWNSSQP